VNLSYPDVARSLLDHIDTQSDAVDEVAALIAASLLDDGVVQAFGTGHARLIVHEMSGRAGGLVPVNLVRLGDLVTYGGRPPSELADPLLERDPSLAAPVLELSGAREGDVFLIASNSGINGSVVELASLAKARGHSVVAITSLAHSRSVDSRHPSGKKLYELADITLDTGAPPGDATIRIAPGIDVGAVSSLGGVVLVQMLTEAVCRMLQEAGQVPYVYRSMNLPGSDETNALLEAKYRGRVRPIEP